MKAGLTGELLECDTGKSRMFELRFTTRGGEGFGCIIPRNIGMNSGREQKIGRTASLGTAYHPISFRSRLSVQNFYLKLIKNDVRMDGILCKIGHPAR